MTRDDGAFGRAWRVVLPAERPLELTDAVWKTWVAVVGSGWTGAGADGDKRLTGL